MTTIKACNGYDIISRKILLNKISLDELKMLKEYSTLNIKAHQLSIKLYDKKEELVKKLNEVYEMQLNEYTKERNDICMDYCELIDELDNDPDRDNLLKKINEIHEKICDLMNKSSAISKTIPENAIFTNTKLKLSDEEDVANPNMSCGMQTNNY